MPLSLKNLLLMTTYFCLDEDLIKRIKDLINGDDKSISVEPPASKKAKISGVSVSKVKIEAEIDPESLRMPNSRGQMNWNKIAINDLLECHLLAQEVFGFLKILFNQIGRYFSLKTRTSTFFWFYNSTFRAKT